MPSKSEILGIIKQATADLMKLDAKGISPGALQAIYAGNIQEAMQHPGVVALVARRKERMRRIIDELQNPGSHLKPQKPEPAEEAIMEDPNASMGPAAPGGPMPPSNLLGMFDPNSMQGAPAGAKISSAHPAEFVKLADEGEAESPQEEAAESVEPDVIQELVNTIVSKGQGIDDEDVHMKAESMGVNPHEAEEEIYRLLAELVGGKNDVVEGGLAAGMPTSDFPNEQIEKGTEVELEHTPNPAIAQEIAKDHLVEGDDYYEPRLENLEQEMESDKEEGKIEGINEETSKGKQNTEEKKENVEKFKEEKEARVGAFKFGYFKKVAELGMKPSEFMKAADNGGSTLGWMGEKALGAGKTVATAPMVAAPILGALLGGGYRLATSPSYESPEDMREIELLALYKKLARQALLRASKIQQARLAATGSGDEKPIKIPAVA